LQESARGTSPGFGGLDAEEYFAVQASGIRLRAQHDLLRGGWSIIQRLWILATQIFGITSVGLFDDWAGIALGRCRELFGEQEI
jgi:hypothetical protein